MGSIGRGAFAALSQRISEHQSGNRYLAARVLLLRHLEDAVQVRQLVANPGEYLEPCTSAGEPDPIEVLVQELSPIPNARPKGAIQ